MAYTDYAEADIQTHRTIARANKWFAAAAFVGGSYLAITRQSGVTFPWVLAATALVYVVAISLEVQANRWAIDELEEADDGQ